jgi:outer membrane lipoprotein SlyB
MAIYARSIRILALVTLLGAGGTAQAQTADLLSGRNIGAVGGAVAGGIAGKQLVGKKNRTLGIAGGALAGGLVGGVAGNMYDKSGKRAVHDPMTTGSVTGSKSSLINGQNVGIVAGAVGGGVLGNKLGGKKHKTLGTIGGVVGGGLVGGAVGSAFDRR